MAIPGETLASPSALCPASEVDHCEKEIGKLRILLLVLMLIESASIVAARVWNQWRGEFAYLPQILIGFVVLALILTLHLSSQRKILREVSAALVKANSYIGMLEQMSLIDPTTQLFNRRYLAELFNHQLKGLTRSGKPVTLLLLEVIAGGQNVAVEQMTVEAAFILRSNFRASDYLVRYSIDQFLVILPDTDREQAQFALSRLIDKVSRWNSVNTDRQMGLCLELSTSIPDAKIWERLAGLEEKISDKTAPEIRILVPAEA